MFTTTDETANVVDEALKEEVPVGARFDKGTSKTKLTDPVGAPLRIGIINADRDFDALEEAWNTLLNQPGTGASIFQTFEWQRLLWKYFNSDNELHIITFWNEDRLVGIAPFYLESTSFMGLFNFRKLQFIGNSIPDTKGLFSHYSPTDYLDMIVHPDFKKKVAKSLVIYLQVNRLLFDQIELNELPEEGIFMTDIFPEIKRAKWSCKQIKREVCPKIHLPGSIEEYLDDLDRKVRYELRYSKRAVIEKDLFRVFKVTNESELDAAFNHFVELHQKRWNKQGYPGIFSDPHYQDFLKNAARAFLRRGWLMMTTAKDKEGQCIAVEFAFKFKNRIYDYQKAFDADSDLAKYSPGKALLYFMIEAAIEDGLNFVDLLRGGEKYKLRLTNNALRNWRIIISDSTEGNRWKYWLNRMHQYITDLIQRVGREFLLLRVHIKQWGITDFWPNYFSFLKGRLCGKLPLEKPK